MPAEDPETTRRVRAQITRRYVDSSQLDVRVMHGTVYLRGVLRQLRTHREVDLEKEMETISHVLRQQPGVRDVVWEATLRA
jgi:osmotically-inducible protein OsmY